MGILYLFSCLILIISFILIRKKEKTADFLVWFSITLVLKLCYNSFICYIFDLFHIPIELIYLMLLNLAISGIMIFHIKNKGIQKYEFNKQSFIVCSILLIAVLSISLVRFNFFNNISYETTDPALHYSMAFDFYKSNSLLTENTLFPSFGDFEGTMIISYVNIGLLFKSMTGIIPEMYYYKLFTFFDALMFAVSCLSFISSISFIMKEKHKLTFFILIVAFFYIFGYPLNNMLFGFFYLGITIMVINTIITVIEQYKDEELNKYDELIFLIILFLLNFSVFFGYYLFVPVVYASEFIYFFIENVYSDKKLYLKNIFEKRYVLMNCICLFLPFILGFIFFLFPSSGGETGSAISPFANEGYIYRDLYSNFIIFIPFILYQIYSNIKSKKYDFSIIFFIIQAIFTLGIFIFVLKGMAATYYFYKNYFVLSLLCFYIFLNTINSLVADKNIAFINCCGITIVLLFSAFILNLENKLYNINILINPTPKITSYFDIYANNRNYLNNSPILDEKDIQTIIYYENNKEKLPLYNDAIPVIGSTQMRMWFYCLTLDNPNFNSQGIYNEFNEESFTFEEFKGSNYEHFISLYSFEELGIDRNDLSEFEIIFENSSSFILKRK